MMKVSKFYRCFGTLSETVSRCNTAPRKDPECKPEHIFRKVNPWKSRAEFVNHLRKKVIYNQDGIIAINKPYGVTGRHPLPSSTRTATSSPFLSESQHSIEECLPELSTLLNISKLLLVTMPETYSSGVCVLATDEGTRQRAIESLRKALPMKLNPYSYLVITLGRPVPEYASERVGLSWLTNEELGKKLPVIVKDFSKNSVERHLVKGVTVDYATAAYSNLTASGKEPLGNASLVDMQVSSGTNHFLRVFLADRLSPVLGDHIYGNRVATVMGTAMRMGPVHAAGVGTHQKIPQNILDRLGVKHATQVPTFLHLKQIKLPKIYKKTDIVIQADLPDHFTYACKCFGLDC